ncbi:MAG: hypothetical protein M1118_05685 [Chloroflexi bacterium]|nr:hypothetical protein [Chloroflexota bacterium]
MQEEPQGSRPPKWLSIIAVVLIVIGASLMDQAGRTQSTLWWTVSGIFAGVGLVLAVVYLVLLEGLSWFRIRPDRSRHLRNRHP